MAAPVRKFVIDSETPILPPQLRNLSNQPKMFRGFSDFTFADDVVIEGTFIGSCITNP